MEPKKYRMMMDQLTRPGKPKPRVNKTNTLDNISKRIEEAVDLYEDQPVPQTRIKPLQELEKDLAN